LLQTFAQLEQYEKIVLISIEGGPVSNLEAQEMNKVKREAQGDLKQKNLHIRVETRDMEMADFRNDYSGSAMAAVAATAAAGAELDLEQIEDAEETFENDAYGQADVIKSGKLKKKKGKWHSNRRFCLLEFRPKGSQTAFLTYYDAVADGQGAQKGSLPLSSSEVVLAGEKMLITVGEPGHKNEGKQIAFYAESVADITQWYVMVQCFKSGVLQLRFKDEVAAASDGKKEALLQAVGSPPHPTLHIPCGPRA
jgi:hypothetical protein